MVTGTVANPAEPLLVVVLGPTASGKSALAVSLAESFNGEIVSCDSVAVYRGMDIGTAKPSREERVRVPHHLLDVAAPDDAYSAGDYARAARAAVADIAQRRKLPLVSGGTGLYLRALLLGLFPGPHRDQEVRERLRAELDQHGAEHLHRMLEKMDAAAAERIHANDVPKIIRAIEVCLASRQAMTEAWQSGRDRLEGYRVLRIGLEPPRAELYARINRRVEEMFIAGLIEETRGLLDRYGPHCRALAALGYKQAAAVVRGEMTEAEAIASTAQGHRNYAKRQMTWFRREPDVHWFRSFGLEQSSASKLLLKNAMENQTAV